MQSCWNCHVMSLSLSVMPVRVFVAAISKNCVIGYFFGLFFPNMELLWELCPLHLRSPSLLLNSPSVKSSNCLFSSGDTPKITLESTPRADPGFVLPSLLFSPHPSFVSFIYFTLAVVSPFSHLFCPL